MADMKQRIETIYLLDFYGPLLTGHQQEVMRLYCEEDLTLAEIAEQLSITRQGASDALRKASAQLEKCEELLGLVRRYHTINHEVREAQMALEHPDEEGIAKARACLETILKT